MFKLVAPGLEDRATQPYQWWFVKNPSLICCGGFIQRE